MNNVVDIAQDDMPDNAPSNTSEVAVVDGMSSTAAAFTIPFVFAKRNGVLVSEVLDEHVVVLMRPGVSSATLAEVRRYLSRPVHFDLIDADEFDARLQKAYEQHSGEAMQMMGDLDDEADLFAIAQALPEPEDLLESEDDAPIIRLINALLTQAIKEDASDIHIEPYETRLVVRFRVDGMLRK